MRVHTHAHASHLNVMLSACPSSGRYMGFCSMPAKCSAGPVTAWLAGDAKENTVGMSCSLQLCGMGVRRRMPWDGIGEDRTLRA